MASFTCICTSLHILSSHGKLPNDYRKSSAGFLSPCEITSQQAASGHETAHATCLHLAVNTIFSQLKNAENVHGGVQTQNYETRLSLSPFFFKTRQIFEKCHSSD